ncbi:hypothetical protein SYNPS1DRAFT_27574 [Syncephalis pseudoplumigaleata]|uniref:Uncharacterized protein n=1 Tax=Syncephalis pseudoplumigaleata TaxID=1712513 RepID=A0A4P9Z2Z7_9FUNG|nr:hypothetical protein SYNPS1DRAFT_27574 [Syncephalis pseudoplumigaleata]|eukprot:RKP26748.1 hypothetical protein SYNPS1DRAFT_27574 [Syncephalis pseudoplumigaleata]
MGADGAVQESGASLNASAVYSGDILLYEFINGLNEGVAPTMKNCQARLTGLQRQVAVYTVVSLVFMRNLYVASRAFKGHARNLSTWCVFVVSLLGASSYFISLAIGLQPGLSCSHLGLFMTTILCVSTMCNGIVVLHKAYLALLRRRWVAIVGGLTTAIQLGFTVSVFFSARITTEPYNGCIVHYTDTMIYAWIGTVIPVNLFFSAIFSYVAYSQYRLYGSEAWRRLAKDGIQTMCMVVLCNIVCSVFIASRVFGASTQLFFVVDW